MIHWVHTKKARDLRGLHRDFYSTEDFLYSYGKYSSTSMYTRARIAISDVSPRILLGVCGSTPIAAPEAISNFNGYASIS